MTEIDFYIHAEDRMQVACTLAAKAYERGLRSLIYVPDKSTADRLDALLWNFQPLSFLPHCRGGDRLASSTPILIDHQPELIDRDDILLNLHPEQAPFFSRFQRLIEIVSQENEDRLQARERYRFYRDRGYEIRTHDLSRLNKRGS